MEPRVLGAFLAAGGAGWAFIEIAEEVSEGEVAHPDTMVFMALRNPTEPALPMGPQWLIESARDITALGGASVLTLVVITAVIFLLLIKERASAAFISVVSIGGILLSTALKEGFGRERPGLGFHGMAVFTSSFPSGHAVMSAIVYLTVGALLARLVPSWHLKSYVLGVATILTLLVGISRVYLGVHWPSDVFAGWAIGAGWALGCWAFAHFFQLDTKEQVNGV